MYPELQAVQIFLQEQKVIHFTMDLGIEIRNLIT